MRVYCNRDGLAAQPMSAITPAASTISSTRKDVAGRADSAIGRAQMSAISPARPVRITSVAPGPRPKCRRVRQRVWRPPTLPPAEASPGGVVSAGPSPSRRRASRNGGRRATTTTGRGTGGADDVDEVTQPLVGDKYPTHGVTARRQLGRPGHGTDRGQVARIEAVRVAAEDGDFGLERRQWERP